MTDKSEKLATIFLFEGNSVLHYMWHEERKQNLIILDQKTNFKTAWRKVAHQVEMLNKLAELLLGLIWSKGVRDTYVNSSIYWQVQIG